MKKNRTPGNSGTGVGGHTRAIVRGFETIGAPWCFSARVCPESCEVILQHNTAESSRNHFFPVSEATQIYNKNAGII